MAPFSPSFVHEATYFIGSVLAVDAEAHLFEQVERVLNRVLNTVDGRPKVVSQFMINIKIQSSSFNLGRVASSVH